MGVTAVGARTERVGRERARTALRVVPTPDRPAARVDPRAVEMIALRRKGLTLAEIAGRYGVSRQRVAQIIDASAPGRVPISEVLLARLSADGRRVDERAGEILELWRAGVGVGKIHERLGVSYRQVRETVAERASDADRAARERAYQGRIPAPEYSDKDLLRGVRRVAGELGGQVPSLARYRSIAAELGLASAQTVYVRFGSWRRALEQAGLERPAPPRIYSPKWHLAACWRALESVADQLGDPPRYQRYVALAADRDDLPSGTTLRIRLGSWPQITAALKYHQQRRDRAASEQDAGAAAACAPVPASGEADRPGERMVSMPVARALRHLATNPGSSGAQVRHGVGVRHPSQVSGLLARLERDGLAARDSHGRANAWTLTRRGERVLERLPRDAYLLDDGGPVDA